MLQRIAERSIEDFPPRFQHHDAARQSGDHVEIVGDQDQRAAQLLKTGHELVAAFGVQTGGRLIEHQHFRLHRQHARNGDPTLLAARERKRGAIAQRGQVQTDAVCRFSTRASTSS